jgi:hypothetical protein
MKGLVNMKFPKMTLFRAVVFSIIVGMPTHFAVKAWAAPKKKPRKATTRKVATRIATPQIVIPNKQCYPLIPSLIIGFVPSVSPRTIVNTYQYNCQGGEVYGCSVVMAEILYISSGGTWFELTSECTTVTKGCLTTGLVATNSAINITTLPTGTYLYGVGFYTGNCEVISNTTALAMSSSTFSL